MYFIAVICLALSLFFFVFGRRHHEPRMTMFGLCFLLAAFGIGMITFFALNALG